MGIEILTGGSDNALVSANHELITGRFTRAKVLNATVQRVQSTNSLALYDLITSMRAVGIETIDAFLARGEIPLTTAEGT
jgi:hypothetical protein